MFLPPFVIERFDDYRLIGSIHSHGSMGAFHSSTDDGDEFDFDGLHITVGTIDTNPTYSCRFISCGHDFKISDIKDIVEMPELSGEFPEEWSKQVSKKQFKTTYPRMITHYNRDFGYAGNFNSHKHAFDNDDRIPLSKNKKKKLKKRLSRQGIDEKMQDVLIENGMEDGRIVQYDNDGFHYWDASLKTIVFQSYDATVDRHAENYGETMNGFEREELDAHRYQHELDMRAEMVEQQKNLETTMDRLQNTWQDDWNER